MTLYIRLSPNAARTAFAGRRDGTLILKVNAPARDGKANKAAILYLANIFGVSRSAVHLRSGEVSGFFQIGRDDGRKGKQLFRQRGDRVHIEQQRPGRRLENRIEHDRLDLQERFLLDWSLYKIPS